MRRGYFFIALVITCLATAQAHADPNDVVAGPGAALAGYVTTTVHIHKSEALTFANLDPISHHNVISVLTDSEGRHLFESPLTGVGTVDVAGVADLAVGSYQFFCFPHSGVMKGTLIVDP